MLRSRRGYLAAIGASVAISAAGCNQLRNEESSSTSQSATSTGTASTVTDDAVIRFGGGDQAALQGVLETLGTGGASKLVFDPGTYRFQLPEATDPGVFFSLREAEDVVIDGQGATIVFSDPLSGGLVVQGGRGVTIKNLEFDYDPLPFTQAAITAVGDSKRRVRVEVADGYPLLSHEMFAGSRSVAGSVHNPDGSFRSGLRDQPGAVFLRVESVEPVGGRIFELTFTRTSPIHLIEEGLLIAFGIRNAQGIVALGTDAFVLENVAIRAAPGMGLNTTRCASPVLRDVTVAPPRGSGRCLGSNADALHLSNCPSGPTISGCRIRRTRDDAIVINSEMLRVVDVDGHAIHCGKSGKLPIEPGDRLVPMRPTGGRRSPLPPVSEVTYRFPDRRSWAPNVPETITFDAPVSAAVAVGDYIGNEDAANAGFAISDTTVRSCGANAIRLAARSGRIRDCTIDGTGWRGIAMRCDSMANREPQRWTDTVTIEHNTIVRTGMTNIALAEPAAIHATHNPAEGFEGVGRPHHDITVTGNEILEGAYLGLQFEDTTRVSTKENTLRNLNRLPFPDGGGFGLGFDNVANGTITGTTVSGPASALYQFGWQKATASLSASDNRLSIDGTDTTPQVVTWIPMTLQFNQTTNPGGDRYISFRCLELALVDTSGADIMRVEIGGREMPVQFGTGVYSVDNDGGTLVRWFGGAEKQGTLYATATDVTAATHLQLRGNPAMENLTAELVIEDAVSDTLRFGSPDQVRTYEVALPS